jgi:hypothetical protein
LLLENKANKFNNLHWVPAATDHLRPISELTLSQAGANAIAVRAGGEPQVAINKKAQRRSTPRVPI